MIKVRKHYLISGKVQGVGFRFNAKMLADKLQFTGWVKNLPDGKVELELQGEEEKLDTMLQQLGQGTCIKIYNVETYEMQVKEEKNFKVLY